VVADYTYLGPLRAALREEIDAALPTPGRERDDIAERMTITVTELTTNALRHGRSAAFVQLSRSQTAFVLDVADDAPSAAPQILDVRALEAAGGRGLHISHELASGMGWYVKQGRKHVWAQFRLPRRVRRRQAPRIPVFDLKAFLRQMRRLGH
jgi:serine/threonine-protein kinase RsbW